MSDAELRRLERASTAGDPEAEARYRRTLARSTDQQSELQRDAFLSFDLKAIERLCRETPGAQRLRPERVHLAAFLGHPQASEALGITAAPPDEFQEWLDCIHHWGGDDAGLQAGIAIGIRWLPQTATGEKLLHRARKYAAKPGFIRDELLRRAVRLETGQRTSGAFVIFNPGGRVLHWALDLARSLGGSDGEIRMVAEAALLAWLDQH